MALAQLLELDGRRVFEATHRFDDLDVYHVPFDELTGRPETEAVLARMAGREARVAVIGASGSGKSSLVASVLGPFAEQVPDHIVPLRIPVAGEADETVTETRAFLGHLIGTITRWASPELFTEAERAALDRATAARSNRPGTERLRKFHIGIPGWLADAGFAFEVRTTGEDIEQRLGAGDAISEARRMVELFRSHGRTPLLVIDDSDSWLRIPDLDRTHIANAFFTKNVRALATELECGFVIAVHEEYLELPSYQEVEGLISTSVWVPRFDAHVAGRAIRQILERRIQVHEVAAELDDVFQPEALDGLEWHYHTGANGSLRDVLKVADRAVQHACSDSAERVTKQLVIQGLAEWW
jgi:energy-coupling factor transporter ATP-binding protein EcfA2